VAVGAWGIVFTIRCCSGSTAHGRDRHRIAGLSAFWRSHRCVLGTLVLFWGCRCVPPSSTPAAGCWSRDRTALFAR
jgi:hypothetical protein